VSQDQCPNLSTTPTLSVTGERIAESFITFV